METTFLADSWLADFLTTPEHETLTKALQHCQTQTHSDQTTNTTAPHATLKTSTPLQPRKKRKPRATKKTHTTYINADPANFRQMVQQVTGGVCFEGMHVHAEMVRPQPKRLRLGGAGLWLPTLDTSELLIRGEEPARVVDFGGGFPTLESSFSRVVDSGFLTF